MFYEQNKKSSPGASSGWVLILNLWITSYVDYTIAADWQTLFYDSLTKCEFEHLKEFWINDF
jgi:hypothetical protein